MIQLLETRCLTDPRTQHPGGTLCLFIHRMRDDHCAKSLPIHHNVIRIRFLTLKIMPLRQAFTLRIDHDSLQTRKIRKGILQFLQFLYIHTIVQYHIPSSIPHN